MRPKKRKARKTLVKAIRVEPDINRRMLLAGFGEDAPPLLYLTAGYLDSPFLEKLLPPDQWVPIVQTHVDGLAKEFIRVLQRRDYKTLLRVAHMLKKGASPEPVDRWRASICLLMANGQGPLTVKEWRQAILYDDPDPGDRKLRRMLHDCRALVKPQRLGCVL